jgi:alkylated DNA repair dioxygenase AlkB
MKRHAGHLDEAHGETQPAVPIVEPRKKYKRHALNTGGSSWVDSFQLPDQLKLNRVEFEQLWTLHPAELGQVKLFNKPQATPRWQQAYGQPYHFSGMQHDALPVPPLVQRYMDYANSLGEYVGDEKQGSFNMALLNWYQDGAHHIGYHADDESEMRKSRDGETMVFSLSFGQQRPLALKPKSSAAADNVALKVEQPNNSALVMGGLCQRTHKHAVPKVQGAKGKNMGRRINVTFRKFKVAD